MSDPSPTVQEAAIWVIGTTPLCACVLMLMLSLTLLLARCLPVVHQWHRKKFWKPVLDFLCLFPPAVCFSRCCLAVATGSVVKFDTDLQNTAADLGALHIVTDVLIRQVSTPTPRASLVNKV
jgi:hypothetical protein